MDPQAVVAALVLVILISVAILLMELKGPEPDPLFPTLDQRTQTIARVRRQYTHLKTILGREPTTEELIDFMYPPEVDA